jgi:hypothetical protein
MKKLWQRVKCLVGRHDIDSKAFETDTGLTILIVCRVCERRLIRLDMVEHSKIGDVDFRRMH